MKEGGEGDFYKQNKGHIGAINESFNQRYSESEPSVLKERCPSFRDFTLLYNWTQVTFPLQ